MVTLKTLSRKHVCSVSKCALT